MKLLDNFKYFNRIKKAHTCVQWLLIGMLIFGLQVILAYVSFRFDFSANHVHQLQPVSKAFLQSLKSPIKLFVFVKNHEEPKPELLRKIRSLAYNFQNEFRGRTSFFEYQEVDVLRNPKLFLSLREQYKTDISSGILLVLSEENTSIAFSELEHNKSFVGESALIRSLAQLASPAKNIYWIVGHGELDGCDNHPEKGGSVAHQVLKQMHCNVEFLNLGNAIPEDADAVVVFGPKIPFLPQECTELKKYLFERHGHVLLCLQPVYEHGLNDFLKSLGAFCDSEIVLDSSPDLLNGSGNLLIRRFNPHPLTQPLIDRNIGLVFGLTTRLVPDTNASFLSSCILSSETSWTKSKQNLNNILFDSNNDPVGPHVLCLCYNNLGDDRYHLNLHPDKAVIVGCSEWLDNAHIHLLGNRFLLQSIYRYFENTTVLPPYTTSQNSMPEKLVLSQSTFLTLILNFSLLPFIFFIAGIIVVILRKE